MAVLKLDNSTVTFNEVARSARKTQHSTEVAFALPALPTIPGSILGVPDFFQFKFFN